MRNFKVILILIFCIISSATCNIDIELMNKIKFYLYPKPNDGQYREEIIYQDVISLQNSAFCVPCITVIIVHGFVSDATGMQKIIDAYVNSGFYANYIAIDWSIIAGPVNFNPISLPVRYPLTVVKLPLVSQRMANFIEWLALLRVVDIGRIHMVGHSLGAHVSGEVGDLLQKSNGGRKLARITGLDPALPLFWPAIKSRNLNRDDAYFVDVIHTNAYKYGDFTVDGHADFYPNGGSVQTGCNLLSNIFFCSHNYAVTIYVKSFVQPYIACQCSQSELDKSNFLICLQHCPNPAFLGVYCSHTARGQYALNT